MSGFVYYDANNDGIFQGAESPIPGTTVSLTGTVRQKAGRFHIISANFGGPNKPVYVQSPGEASWSVQVLGNGGSFGGGTAFVSVTATSYDPITGQYAAVETTQAVHFKGKK